MRLIDADALNVAEEVRAACEHVGLTEKSIFEACVTGWLGGAIDVSPTIDAVPVVRGEWVQKHHIISLDNMTLTGTYPTCSLCGYAWIGVAKNTNYCPNCGAKMEDKPCE